MNTDKHISVLIADDHPVVREGLSALINRRPDMQVIAEAATGREAVAQFLRYSPDVALIDLRMPLMDGLEAIGAIRERVPSARIIIMTTYDGDEDIYRALSAGAKGYLLKDTPKESLAECILAVYEGRSWIPSAVGEKLATRLNAAHLTDRELDVLRLVVRGQSNKEIGVALDVTEGTIKVHVNHILEKLGAYSRTEAINIALRRGIMHL